MVLSLKGKMECDGCYRIENRSGECGQIYYVRGSVNVSQSVLGYSQQIHCSADRDNTQPREAWCTCILPLFAVGGNQTHQYLLKLRIDRLRDAARLEMQEGKNAGSAEKRNCGKESAGAVVARCAVGV